LMMPHDAFAIHRLPSFRPMAAPCLRPILLFFFFFFMFAHAMNPRLFFLSFFLLICFCHFAFVTARTIYSRHFHIFHYFLDATPADPLLRCHYFRLTLPAAFTAAAADIIFVSMPAARRPPMRMLLIRERRRCFLSKRSSREYHAGSDVRAGEEADIRHICRYRVKSRRRRRCASGQRLFRQRLPTSSVLRPRRGAAPPSPVAVRLPLPASRHAARFSRRSACVACCLCYAAVPAARRFY